MISIIIPVFDEEGSLLEFNSRLISAIRITDRQYEIIYIDDGSLDGSYNLLLSMAKENLIIRVLRLDGNYGQTFALRAGLDYSKGEIIVFIDADLQNDPEDIPKLLKKIDEGYDLVNGWRRRRKDNFVTRIIPSIIANKIISLTLGIKLHDIGCGLKVCRKSLLKKIDFYGEMHRIIPIYILNSQSKVAEIEVKHDYRKYGDSKYGMSRIFKLVLDVVSAYFVVKYSKKPMYFFGFLGLSLVLLGIIAVFFIVLRVIWFGGIWISPLLFMSIMSFLVGSQVILMGLSLEVLMKLYYNKEPQKPYIIKSTIEKGVEIKDK